MAGNPLGILPLGTANLLARNLGLPLDPGAALDVACARHTRRIDTVVLRVDDGEPQRFSVMAGDRSRRRDHGRHRQPVESAIGPAAYFVAACRAAGRLPVALQVSVDGGRRHRRKSMLCPSGTWEN